MFEVCFSWIKTESTTQLEELGHLCWWIPVSPREGVDRLQLPPANPWPEGQSSLLCSSPESHLLRRWVSPRNLGCKKTRCFSCNFPTAVPHLAKRELRVLLQFPLMHQKKQQPVTSRQAACQRLKACLSPQCWRHDHESSSFAQITARPASHRAILQASSKRFCLVSVLLLAPQGLYQWSSLVKLYKRSLK